MLDAVDSRDDVLGGGILVRLERHWTMSIPGTQIIILLFSAQGKNGRSKHCLACQT